MVEKSSPYEEFDFLASQTSVSSNFEQQCQLHRIFDPCNTGVPLVPNDKLGVNLVCDGIESKRLTNRLSVSEAFSIRNWSFGSSFQKAQNFKYSGTLQKSFEIITKPKVKLDERISEALKVLRDGGTKGYCLLNGNELQLLNKLNVGVKPDQVYKILQAPEQKVKDSCLSEEKLQLLIMFLHSFAVDHFFPKDSNLRQSDGQKIIIERDKVTNLRSILPIIVCCYFKLVCDKAISMVFADSPKIHQTFDKVNELCEQITLMSDSFALIIQSVFESTSLEKEGRDEEERKKKSKPPQTKEEKEWKDACESMLYISHVAIDQIKQFVRDKRQNFSLEQKVLIEQVIFSCTSTVACFFGPKTYKQCEALDIEHTLFGRGTQIIKTVLQIVPYVTQVFFENLSYPSKRHYIPNLSVFQPSERMQSLLCIVLSATFQVTNKWQEKIKVLSPQNLFNLTPEQLKALALKTLTTEQKEQIRIFENFQNHILKAFYEISTIQIQFYMKTETQVEQNNNQQQKSAFEEIKTLPVAKYMSTVVIVERDSEGETSDQEDNMPEEKLAINQSIVENQSNSGQITEEAELTRGNLPGIKHTSNKFLPEQDKNYVNTCILNEKLLELNENAQKNWIATNFTLFDICGRLFPYYYASLDSPQDLTLDQIEANEKELDRKTKGLPPSELEISFTQIHIDNHQSYFSHICHLYKITFYFILRFNAYDANKNCSSHLPFIERLSELPSAQLSYIEQLNELPSSNPTCKLDIALKKFFNQIFHGNNKQYNQKVLIQIFEVVDQMVVYEAFDPVDNFHFFKVYFLNMMLHYIDTYYMDDLDFYEKCLALTKSLFSLFKKQFIEEKYLSLVEDVFELDIFDHLNQLQNTIFQEESKLGHSRENIIKKINQFVVQRLSMAIIIKICSQDQVINARVWNLVSLEFVEGGICYATCGIIQGDSFQERQVELILPQRKGIIYTLEYQHKATQVIIKSEIYMFIKLAMGLLSQEKDHQDSRRVYHTLIQNNTHFLKFHKAEHPIILQQANNNGTGIKVSQNPVYQDQLNINNKGQPPLQCEDCLRFQFQKFELTKLVQLENLDDFWQLIFKKLKELSILLFNYQREKDKSFDHTKSQENSEESKNLIYQRNTQKRKDILDKQSFKIAEKIYNVLKRFVIFATQNKQIVDRLLGQFITKRIEDVRNIQNANMQQRSRQSPNVPTVNRNEKKLYEQDFKEIKDDYFKILILRNFIFHTRMQAPDSPQAVFIIDQLNTTFRAIKFSWNQFQLNELFYHNKEKERVLFSNLFSEEKTNEMLLRASGRHEPKSMIPNQIKTILGDSREEWVKDKTQTFKEMAQSANSILGLYIQVQSQIIPSLYLLERKGVLDLLMILIRKVVFAEGNFANDFVNSILHAYLFEKAEDIDPQNLTDSTTLPVLMQRNLYVQNNSQLMLQPLVYQEKLFEFLIQSCIEFIRISKEETFTNLDRAKMFKQNTLIMVKSVINQLYNEANSQLQNYYIIKLSRTIKRETINLIKKLIIFLREQCHQSMLEFGKIDKMIEQAIFQLRWLIVKVFQVAPKALQMRDFFSILREIFFYNNQMDEIDAQLTEDILQILNGTLRTKNEQLSRASTSSNSIKQYSLSSICPLAGSLQCKLVDYFYFSKYSPGMIVLNDFKMNKDPSICMLFKVDFDDIEKEMRNAKLDSDSSLIKKMVLLSIMQREEDDDKLDSIICFKTLDINLNIFFKNEKLFYFLELHQMGSTLEKTVERSLDDEWHFLFIRNKKTSGSVTVQIHVDSFENSGQHSSIDKQVYGINTEADHYIVLGNSAETLYRLKKIQKDINDCLETSKATSLSIKERESNKEREERFKKVQEKQENFRKIELENDQYFRGKCSLPFFIGKLNDFAKTLQDTQVAKALRDSLIDLINTKNMLGHNTSSPLDLNYFIYRAQKQEELIQTIKDSKGYGLKQIFAQQDLSEVKLKKSFEDWNKKKETNKLKDFSSLDEYTSQVILVHHLANQKKHLAAIHCKMPSEVFIGLGGFNNLYPLVENVIKSNLMQVNNNIPGNILKWLFIILNSLLHSEPGNVKKLFESRNLLMTLKLILLRVGQQNMITQELLSELKNIVKKNVLARLRFKQINDIPLHESSSGLVKPNHLSQRYIHTANATVRANEFFFQDFLVEFVNKVLLDIDLACQPCQVKTNQQYKETQLIQTTGSNSLSFMDQSGKQNQQQPQTQTKFVIDDLIDFISNICCPPDLDFLKQQQQNILTQLKNQQFQENFQGKIYTDDRLHCEAYTDFDSLRDIIINQETQTVQSLLNLILVPKLQDFKHLQLLQKIAKCAADAIIFRKDSESLKKVLKEVYKWKNLSLLTLKVYLLIIFKIIRDPSSSRKDNALFTVFSKDFDKNLIAQILNQQDLKGVEKEEDRILQDQVISLILLILVQFYINTKNKKGQSDIIDKVSSYSQSNTSDSDRRDLIKYVPELLSRNQCLREKTYLALMFIAFQKRKISELPFSAIPTADEIIKIIKNVRLRHENLQPKETQKQNGWLDIDFLFIVLEQFQRYDSKTKKVCLTHIQFFLKFHQKSFLDIFEEVNNNEINFKEKLRCFFYMIIDECIPLQGKKISTFGQDIILDVCTEKFHLTYRENQELQPQQLVTVPQSLAGAVTPVQNGKQSKLDKKDYEGLKDIKDIFLMFKNEDDLFLVFSKFLIRLMRDQENAFGGSSKIEQAATIKLGLKLIILLQFLEELFLNNPSISKNTNFIETLVVFMHVMEKLKIKDFSLPDFVSEYFYSKKQQVIDKKLDDKGFALVNDQLSGSMINKQPKGDMVEKNTQIKNQLKELGIGLEINQMKQSMFEETKVVEIKMNKTRIAHQLQKNDKSHVFINGGPSRIFFHILLKCLNNKNEILPTEVFNTYLETLRFLLFNQISESFASVLQKHLYEEEFQSIQSIQSKQLDVISGFEVRKQIRLNLLNNATIQHCHFQEEEKARNKDKQNDNEKQKSERNVAHPVQSQQILEIIQPTCFEVYQDSLRQITAQYETFAGIKETVTDQLKNDENRDPLHPKELLYNYAANNDIKNNQKYSKSYGYTEKWWGSLPGIGMVQGFCLTFLMSELIELLDSLNDTETVQENLRRSQSVELKNNNLSHTNTHQNYNFLSVKEVEEDDENEQANDFQDNQNFDFGQRQTLDKAKSVIKRNEQQLFQAICEQLQDKDRFAKVEAILHLIYDVIKEQLFNMPLKVKNRKDLSKQPQSELQSSQEDFSKVAGRIFLESIDPMIKMKLEANLDYFVRKSQDVKEAKKDYTFFSSAKNIPKNNVLYPTKDEYFTRMSQFPDSRGTERQPTIQPLNNAQQKLLEKPIPNKIGLLASSDNSLVKQKPISINFSGNKSMTSESQFVSQTESIEESSVFNQLHENQSKYQLNNENQKQEATHNQELFDEMMFFQNERNSWVKSFVKLRIDNNQIDKIKHPKSDEKLEFYIKEFVNKLFEFLHKAYGHNTHISINKHGAYEFRDCTTNELVFNNGNQQNSVKQEHEKRIMITETIYLLNIVKPQLVALSFAAISSDLFKEETKKVWENAENLETEKKLLEKQYEQHKQQTKFYGSANRKLDSSNEQRKKIQIQQSLPVFKQSLNLTLEETKNIQSVVNLNTERKNSVGGSIQLKIDEFPYKKIDLMYSLNFIYTKKNYKKIVKRLTQDPSAIWFDRLERELSEYNDIKQAYKQEVLQKGLISSDDQMKKNYDEMIEKYKNKDEIIAKYSQLKPDQIKNEYLTKFQKEYKADYGDVVENPQVHRYFVKQRRILDRWGRMTLVKPNRKYYDQGKSWLFYRYLLTDYLNKVFALSLLDDADFNDCLVPQSETEFMQEYNQSEKDHDKAPQLIACNSSKDSKSQRKNDFDMVLKLEQGQTDPLEATVMHYEEPEQSQQSFKKFSKKLESLRNEIISRIDKNRLLKKILIEQESESKTDRKIGDILKDFCFSFEQKKQDDQKKLELKTQKKNQKKKIFNHFIENILDQERKNLQKDEKDYIQRFNSELIDIHGVHFGEIITTQEFFFFVSAGYKTPEQDYLFRANKVDMLKAKKQLIYEWNEIEEIITKPCYGPMIGIEILTVEKKIKSFNLLKLEHATIFKKLINLLKTKKLKKFDFVEDPVKAFEEKGFAKNWRNGEKSNQEFLMLLNKYSGRSFNQTNQYPIFPHVLIDYTSQTLEFQTARQNNKVYRDLTKPIQFIFPEKEQWYKKKHLKEKNGIPKAMNFCASDKGYLCAWGFSSQLHILNSMHRLEPFTSSYLKVNKVPEDQNRIMIEINKCLETLKEESYDWTQEMVPEFYYLPEIYTNPNFMHLGVNEETKKIVDKCFLPKWALNHYDQIRVMREALDSKYVTENIGSWIDLVYGCDQFNIDKLNQFFPWMYPEWHIKSSDMYRDWLAHWNRKDADAGNNIDDLQLRCWIEESQNRMQMPLKLFNQPLMQLTVPDKTLKPASDEKDGAELQSQSKNEKSEKVSAEEISTNSKLAVQDQSLKSQGIDNLINHFVQNQHVPDRRELKLNRCADHQLLDQSHNIIHMIIIANAKHCIAFLRWNDPQAKTQKELPYTAVPCGKIVAYRGKVNISKETFKGPQFDIQLRYEQVHHELENIFAEFTDEKCFKDKQFLYVCGYLDNTIKIFDLNKNPGKHLICELRTHNARVTCIKFSKDYKYFISCDADGVIHHYERNCHMGDKEYANIVEATHTTIGMLSVVNKKKEEKNIKDSQFPFTLLYKVQDQMDEIAAIDINETLDMYVTLSRDGTIALRCLRTSKLWHQFKIFFKPENDKPFSIKGFTKNFHHINALKLSLHGYIVVIGPSSRQEKVTQYMIYSINGDLLRSALEKVQIKSVILNSREDQLIIGTNYAKDNDSIEQGNIRVLNLYGLEKIATLNNIVYQETIQQLAQDVGEQKPKQETEQIVSKAIPSIQAMVIGQGERNINIFFVAGRIGQGKATLAKFQTQSGIKESKEIICFDSGMDAVWAHFKNYGIAR